MTAEEIIYNRLAYVYDRSHRYRTCFNDISLHNLANDCVNQIREEFINAGVNVWPTEGRG